MSPERLETAKREFHIMIQQGVARPPNSSWASPLYMISKQQEGEWSECGDYKALSAATIPNRHLTSTLTFNHTCIRASCTTHSYQHHPTLPNFISHSLPTTTSNYSTTSTLCDASTPPPPPHHPLHPISLPPCHYHHPNLSPHYSLAYLPLPRLYLPKPILTHYHHHIPIHSPPCPYSILPHPYPPIVPHQHLRLLAAVLHPLPIPLHFYPNPTYPSSTSITQPPTYQPTHPAWPHALAPNSLVTHVISSSLPYQDHISVYPHSRPLQHSPRPLTMLLGRQAIYGYLCITLCTYQ
ncbi:hypothetical protein Pmani_000202 [Petrolisthes manimaculis]|uniref:Uncharacterized protein n=1 Tax=Petrolisthes manimaculis TaxID=1843537 RepID=A0AAE1QMJ7_9EUCA|nr:hypothetical protein Pmani_000202 [Petrolisthes manimaculis]